MHPLRLSPVLLLVAVAAFAPAARADLVAARVKDVGAPNPAAAYWSTATPVPVMLMGQPMVIPKPTGAGTSSVNVQAVHDGKRVAFRMSWKDSERSEAGRLGEFSDAMALEFPINLDPLPPVMMGARDMPVHLFHWRAQYQRDAERGKPSIKDLYPNANVDMYPMEFTDAEGGDEASRERFSPGVALGNPQSFLKGSVDEVIAEGFSTSSVMEGHGSVAHAEWKDGEWSLVITRDLVIDGGSRLAADQKNWIAFAVWQGGQGDVGSRKSLTMTWTPLVIGK